MKKTIYIFTLCAFFIVSFNACDKENEPSLDDSTTISGVISTDKDLKSEGITKIYAITSEDEIVGESTLNNNNFNVKLESPKRLTELEKVLNKELNIFDKFEDIDVSDIKNELVISNKDVKLAVITKVLVGKAMDEDEHKVLCTKVETDNSYINLITLVYTTDDTNVQGNISGKISSFNYKVSVNLNLKKGWNITEGNFSLSGGKIQTKANIPSAYEWRLDNEISNLFPF